MKQTLIDQKIFNSLDAFGHTLQRWKFMGEKLVFTNGCFDILHLGHISYLTSASQLGTKLIIGLNADESVKILKGAHRPVNNQNARAVLLASLLMVDAVVIFGEETPLNLIRGILPNVLVKGGDYEIENIVGAKDVVSNGGIVQTISFVEGYSTTKILENK